MLRRLPGVLHDVHGMHTVRTVDLPTTCATLYRCHVPVMHIRKNKSVHVACGVQPMGEMAYSFLAIELAVPC